MLKRTLRGELGALVEQNGNAVSFTVVAGKWTQPSVSEGGRERCKGIEMAAGTKYGPDEVFLGFVEKQKRNRIVTDIVQAHVGVGEVHIGR